MSMFVGVSVFIVRMNAAKSFFLVRTLFIEGLLVKNECLEREVVRPLAGCGPGISPNDRSSGSRTMDELRGKWDWMSSRMEFSLRTLLGLFVGGKLWPWKIFLGLLRFCEVSRGVNVSPLGKLNGARFEGYGLSGFLASLLRRSSTRRMKSVELSTGWSGIDRGFEIELLEELWWPNLAPLVTASMVLWLLIANDRVGTQID